MTRTHALAALATAVVALSLASVAFGQIGRPPDALLSAAALELRSEPDASPLLARTAGGADVVLEVRGTAVARVAGEGVFDEEAIGDAARVIAAATGFFDGIEGPIVAFLAGNLAQLAGQGPFPVGVEGFRLTLDVSGDGPPYRVVWSVALPEVPEDAFPVARHALGPADARYVIREFSDLQCPFCARYTLQVFPALEATLLERGDVRFEYHHFVLGGRFANSGTASEAAECVADANPDEPRAFFRYLDALFEQQAVWSPLQDPLPFFVGLAVVTGLASDGVAACVTTGVHRQALLAATARAAALGVAGTPTVFVGPYQLRDFSRLDAYLEAMARIDAFAPVEAVAAGE